MTAAAGVETGLTLETPAEGVYVWQPRRGFRYAMEPFLLAGWALEGGVPATVADLGCGSGIMALLLARRGVRAVGYDVRPEWIPLARSSAARSGLDVSFEVADIRDLAPADHDLALLNPPYFLPSQGPAPADPWKAAARQEQNGSLVELVAAGARLARRVAMILPQARSRDGKAALEEAGLVRMRACHLEPAFAMLEGCRPPAALGRSETVSVRVDGQLSPRVRGWYATLGARLEGHRSPDQCTKDVGSDGSSDR